LNGYATTTVEVDPNGEVRSSSEESYLQYAIKKKLGLKVYQYTMGKKILFDANKKATGVVISTNGTSYTLKARKEVIVSAGAVSETRGLSVELYLCALLVPLPSTAYGLRHWTCCNIESPKNPSTFCS